MGPAAKLLLTFAIALSLLSLPPIGMSQVGIVQRFVGVNWVSPYDWRNNPPQSIATFTPVLHEGSSNLTPGNCGVPFNQGGGYVC